jgi:hypothetical protein
MTDAELAALSAQVMRLQKQAEHQAQAWGKLRMVSGGGNERKPAFR